MRSARGVLAEIKARRIKETLQKIKKDAGAITLGFLADLDKNEAREYLLSLPGVGPKTAAVVLLFAFGHPFMPVDTHVYRVSRRLGIVAEEANIETGREHLGGDRSTREVSLTAPEPAKTRQAHLQGARAQA